MGERQWENTKGRSSGGEKRKEKEELHRSRYREMWGGGGGFQRARGRSAQGTKRGVNLKIEERAGARERVGNINTELG